MAVFSADLRGEFTACNSNFSRSSVGYALQEAAGPGLSRRCLRLRKKADRGNHARLQQDDSGSPASCGRATISRQSFRSTDRIGNRFPVQFSATLLRDACVCETHGVRRRCRAMLSEAHSEANVTGGKAAASVVTPAAPVAAAPVICRKIDDTQFILASPVMHKFMTFGRSRGGSYGDGADHGRNGYRQGTHRAHDSRVFSIAAAAHGSTSTVPRCRRIWSRANSSGTKKARSAAPTPPSPGLFETGRQRYAVPGRDRRTAIADAGQAAARARWPAVLSAWAGTARSR
jgi:hypothetical protein